MALLGFLSKDKKENLEKGLEKTISWYLENEKWLNNVLTGDYEKYYVNQYQKR